MWEKRERKKGEKGIQGMGHPSSPYGLRRDKEVGGQKSAAFA